MPTKVPPRKTLAVNLRLLMDARKMKAPEVARTAKVDAKTINNMLHGRFEPRLDRVEAVAQVFGLTAWQLIIPGMAASLIADGKLQTVVESFGLTDEAGRDNIYRVAEMAAKPYKK